MYIPEKKILDNYANILVNFALNGGKGINTGDVVQVKLPETARQLLESLAMTVLKAGGHPMIELIPQGGYDKLFFQHANDKQLVWVPDHTLRGKIHDANHFIRILADDDPYELVEIDAKRIMANQKAMKPYRDLRDEKENAGKCSWTLGLYGTEAMAKEAGMSLEEYREQIIKACFLDTADPIKQRQEVFSYQKIIKAKLNALQIQSIQLKGEDVDLTVKLGSDRKRLGGSGRNIPSFELFISPDWRGTNGWIRFSEPLYRYGKLIKGIQLWFENGVVVKATATEGEEMLHEMIATENADKIGEFSLTDKKTSRITRFMAETLYDENVGGPYGNTHIALGDAYKDSYIGDPSIPTPAQRTEMGYNESVVHTDIVSTTDRTVTAILLDGSKKIIYANGEFVI